MSPRCRRLAPADATVLDALLGTDPVQNVYLRSELRLHGLRGGAWWGVENGDGLAATMLGGALIVPWLPRPELAASLATGLLDQAPPRMMVGPSGQVGLLQSARRGSAPPREVRDPQPVMVLRRGELTTNGSAQVRPGRADDLDRLTVAAAAMHREEMGIDPLTIDPTGWRTRMGQLVERGWSWVWTERGEVLFKAELSAWTSDVVQIQGVYTAPALRGQGMATAGMAAVCAALFETVPAISLYVNHFNVAARRVYARLGFREEATFATLIF